MRLVFRLRPEYEHLTGATVISPPDGAVYDVIEALAEGNGQITTNDNDQLLQAALISLTGDGGPVMEVTQLDEEGQESPFTPVEHSSGHEQAGPPIDPHPLPGDAGPRQQPDVTVPVNDAYTKLSKDELTQQAEERGVEVSDKATKSELAEALTKADQEGAQTDGSE